MRKYEAYHYLHKKLNFSSSTLNMSKNDKGILCFYIFKFIAWKVVLGIVGLINLHPFIPTKLYHLPKPEFRTQKIDGRLCHLLPYT